MSAFVAASRNASRSTAKSVVNDSVSFYPSAVQRFPRATTSCGESFSFYPSTGTASRIPRSMKSTSEPTIQKASFKSNFSRSELDALFSQSRLHVSKSSKPSNTSSVSHSDSLAFHPAKKVATSTSNGAESSFAFYPSSGVTTRQVLKAFSPKEAASESAKGKDNSMSLFAAGSFAMGLLVQTGRFIARP